MASVELRIPAHTAGTVTSGDVEIFYRRFGAPGGTPILILHGGNYYDSHDWLAVADALATGREVVAYDARGFGESSWSAGHDYSLDAHLADLGALLDHLRWDRVVLLGHSKGSLFTLRFATANPDAVAGVVLVDFSPGHTPGAAPGDPPGHSSAQALRAPAAGPSGPFYATLEDALAASSRHQQSLADPAGRARLQMIFAQRDGGWVNVKRDPRWNSRRPDDDPDWVSAYPELDLWEALAALRAPTLVMRATRSAQSVIRDEQGVAELRRRCPAVTIVDIDSGHDVPGEAPLDLAAAVRGFLSRPVLS